MNEVDQGTQAWYDARAGHITASRIKDVMAQPRKGQKDSAMRKAYMAQLVGERLTGKSLEDDSRSNFFDIRRGKDLESKARTVYDLRRNETVDTAGFVKHPTLPMAGCSPDALVGKLGLAQIKCPRRHVHLDWIMAGVVPSEHKDQMLFELSCHPEREWNDFVSFVEDFPEHLQLFVVRLHRDLARIEAIEEAVAKLNSEIEEVLSRLAKTCEPDLTEEWQKNLEHIKAQKTA